MKNYTMKRAYTKEQKLLIVRALPTGITYQHLIYADDIKEQTWLREKITRFKRRGIFEFRKLGKKGVDGRTGREMLTQTGIDEVYRRLIPDYLKKEKIENISVRNGLNTENLKNLVRLSDAQTFLFGAGVQTPYAMLTQFGVNPFILGVPSKSVRSDSGITILYDAVTDAMIDYIAEQESKGTPLPLPSLDSGHVFLVPNRDNPKYKSLIKPQNRNNPRDKSIYHKEDSIRSFNNSIGILVDLAHKNCFVVFKNLNRNSMYWGSHSYKIFRAHCGYALAQYMEIPFAKQGSVLQDAIILCETKAELKARLKDCEKMAHPFKRILLIVMSREGFAEIFGILNEGIEQYENSICNEIVAKCENVKWRENPTPFYKLEYKSTPIYVGTLIDVVSILSIKRLFNRDNATKPFVACYEYQREYYEDIVGIPADRLLVIPRG